MAPREPVGETGESPSVPVASGELGDDAQGERVATDARGVLPEQIRRAPGLPGAAADTTSMWWRSQFISWAAAWELAGVRVMASRSARATANAGSARRASRSAATVSATASPR